MPTFEKAELSMPRRARAGNHIGAEQSSPQPEPAVAPRRKPRILVVEDSASDSELMLHALKRGGFDSELDILQTAERFKERILKNKCDIILADYRLPDGTAWKRSRSCARKAWGFRLCW
jgi:PleD family two-component response regulator